MSKGRGVYVTVLHLFVKLLCVFNVILQFFLLNAFLGPEYRFWGFGVLRDLVKGRQWEQSGAFPRVCQILFIFFIFSYCISCIFQ
jgi:hypothetical protein